MPADKIGASEGGSHNGGRAKVSAVSTKTLLAVIEILWPYSISKMLGEDIFLAVLLKLVVGLANVCRKTLPGDGVIARACTASP